MVEIINDFLNDTSSIFKSFKSKKRIIGPDTKGKSRAKIDINHIKIFLYTNLSVLYIK